MSATGDQEKCRFDFEFVGTHDEEQIVYAEPHPRRYERVMRDGQQFLLDKYFNTLVSFSEITKDFAKLPMFESPRTINSAPAYALKRREAVKQELETGHFVPPDETPKHHEPFPEDVRDVAFVSVDICGSTARRAANAEAYDSAFRMFMRELAILVGQFHGTVLKTKGDGFIA